jgi:replication-associated recombination protein RarA
VLSAVLAGVKDIREAVERAACARQRPAHVVFVDEVHRFNKAQQDAFLPHVESGLFTFIGATTENPLRGQLGAAVAGHGACAQGARGRRTDALLARAQAQCRRHR